MTDPGLSTRLCCECTIAGALVNCVVCSTRFTLATVSVTYRVNDEVVGYVCPGCLKPDARRRVEAMVCRVEGGDA